MPEEKIKYDEVIITLKLKNEQVWQYTSKQISSIIGKTVLPNQRIDILKARLSGCIDLLNGDEVIYDNDGFWAKVKPKKKSKK